VEAKIANHLAEAQTIAERVNARNAANAEDLRALHQREGAVIALRELLNA
jgi:hypothetical protein